MSLRTYHDPLHHGISLNTEEESEAMVMDLIDSEPFQRLRRIRQLGPAFLTFHGAESSRFTHSLGVFHLARRALKRLKRIDPKLKEYECLLYGASLLHDLGHSPLSHTGEEIFGLRHENWSAKIILEDSSIRKILEKYNRNKPFQIAELLDKECSPNKAVKSLVSSQLDCDRMDYLLRDSYTTGTNYGRLDLERLLSALTIAPDGDLSIHPKGLMAVEHYLVVRNLMYKSVYNHRINEVCNWLLEKIINTARTLGPKEVWADKCMTKWLWHTQEIETKDFLANDDWRTGYHLKVWGEQAPSPLLDLCKRIINRDLLKAVEIGNLTKVKQLEFLAFARNLAQNKNVNPDISCGLRYQKLNGYKPYKGGLRLWDGYRLSAIEKHSSIIQSLIKEQESSWLIYPKEIHLEIKNELLSIND